MTSKAVITFIMLAISSSIALAETGYVQGRQAKIFTSPSMKSAVVVSAKKGDAIEILEKQGRWLKVDFNGQQGWVSKLLVKNSPPMAKISVLENSGEQLQQSARRRASVATASAAARGLRSDGRARQSDEGVADFSALSEMESMSVSEDEALDFMEQGIE